MGLAMHPGLGNISHIYIYIIYIIYIICIIYIYISDIILSYYTYVYLYLISMDWFCWENLQETIDFPMKIMEIIKTIQPSPRLFQELFFRLPHRRHGLIQPEKKQRRALKVLRPAPRRGVIDVYFFYLILTWDLFICIYICALVYYLHIYGYIWSKPWFRSFRWFYKVSFAE